MKRDTQGQIADGRWNYLDGLIWWPTKEKITGRIHTQTPYRTLVAHKGTLAFEDLLRVVGCKTFHTVRWWHFILFPELKSINEKETLTAQYTHIEPGIDVGQFILQKEGWVRKLLILEHQNCTSQFGKTRVKIDQHSAWKHLVGTPSDLHWACSDSHPAHLPH